MTIYWTMLKGRMPLVRSPVDEFPLVEAQWMNAYWTKCNGWIITGQYQRDECLLDEARWMNSHLTTSTGQMPPGRCLMDECLLKKVLRTNAYWMNKFQKKDTNWTTSKQTKIRHSQPCPRLWLCLPEAEEIPRKFAHCPLIKKFVSDLLCVLKRRSFCTLFE